MGAISFRWSDTGTSGAAIWTAAVPVVTFSGWSSPSEYGFTYGTLRRSMTSRGAGVLEETSNPYEANARLAWRNDRRTATDGFRLVMTESVPEAQLKKTDAGLIPQGEGWFVLNARDVSWIRSEERGQDTDFEGGREWTELGFRIQILGPGQHSLYHGENGQEDFLVVSGECVLVIEGEERRLKAWDFVHCPPWTKHAFVGGGDGPCVIVMAGNRAGGFEVVYAVDGVAAKHGASVPEETTKADEAYSGFGPEERTTYQEGWLPW